MKMHNVKSIVSAKKANPAFTLLEVLIAMGLFFMAIFTVLDLTSQNLRAAKVLKRQPIDYTGVIADLLLTNQLQEVTESGDFGDELPGVTWTREIYMVSSNGLFQVDITVTEPTPEGTRDTKASVLLYRPASQTPLGGVRR
jgi:Tfp pilus assembly protein PilV